MNLRMIAESSCTALDTSTACAFIGSYDRVETFRKGGKLRHRDHPTQGDCPADEWRALGR